jgi:putative flavoprotein involved in K+ transport
VSNNVQCIVIGAGQAGVAMSHSVRFAGVRHVVLERGAIAERWRSERWDSFRLLSPNWQTRSRAITIAVLTPTAP